MSSPRNTLSGLRLPTLLLVVILLWILLACLKTTTRNIHTLGSSTHDVNVLWVTRADAFNLVTINPNGVVFSMPLARNSLIALDIRNGSTIWKRELPIEQSDARNLLANENKVFVVTGIGVDAYQAATGELEWSTRLGDGHVSIVSQLDSNEVRIFYGNKLYEIDIETGRIVADHPKGNVVWMSNEIVLQETPEYNLTAIDMQTGELLWSNYPGPYIREDYKPREIGENQLMIGFVSGVCLLNLRTGEYKWCDPQLEIFNMTIDYHDQVGFVMQNDLVLLTIDLQTGDILGETSFLSNHQINEQAGSISSIAFGNGVLIVSFVDSGETFGLEFKDLR